MKISTLASVIVAFVGLSGCSCSPSRPTNEKIATVTQVIDEVKDELNAYHATAPTVKPNIGTCYDGKSPMDLIPEKVTLTLKTVATNLNEPSVGLTAPIGVISFDPAYNGSYSQSKTQTLVVPLNIAKNTDSNTQQATPGEHLLANAISQFRDGILAVNHDKTPCLQYVDNKANFKLSLVFDVVNKSTGGFGLKLAAFKVDDKQTFTNEAHQTLDIEFSMAPGQMLSQ